MESDRAASDRQGLPEPLACALREEILGDLERLKWFLWHGNLYRAQPLIDTIFEGLDCVDEDGGFLVVGDFWGDSEWSVFMTSMRRVFPEREILDIFAQTAEKVQ